MVTLDGKEYALLVNPLEVYISQNPQRRPKATMISSGNWRGYVAHFAVVGREFVVRECGSKPVRQEINAFFVPPCRKSFQEAIQLWRSGSLAT